MEGIFDLAEVNFSISVGVNLGEGFVDGIFPFILANFFAAIGIYLIEERLKSGFFSISENLSSVVLIPFIYGSENLIEGKLRITISVEIFVECFDLINGGTSFAVILAKHHVVSVGDFLMENGCLSSKKSNCCEFEHFVV